MNTETSRVYQWMCDDPQSVLDVDFFVGVYSDDAGLWCDIEELAMMLCSYTSTLHRLGIRGGVQPNFTKTQLASVDWEELANQVAEDRDT